MTDARLGAILGKRLQQDNRQDFPTTPPVDIVSILLTSHTEDRFTRILQRKVSENPESSFTLAEVKASTLAREAADEQQWEKTYKGILLGKRSEDVAALVTQHPFDPDFCDTKGRRVYDIVVCIDGRNPHGIVREILSQLHVMEIIDIGSAYLQPPLISKNTPISRRSMMR